MPNAEYKPSLPTNQIYRQQWLWVCYEWCLQSKSGRSGNYDLQKDHIEGHYTYISL